MVEHLRARPQLLLRALRTPPHAREPRSVDPSPLARRHPGLLLRARVSHLCDEGGVRLRLLEPGAETNGGWQQCGWGGKSGRRGGVCLWDRGGDLCLVLRQQGHRDVEEVGYGDEDG